MVLKNSQKNGAVLLTVLILTMVLTVIVIGIMSVNLSQVKSSQSVIDDIKAEYLSEGYFYKYQQEMASTGNSVLPSSETTGLDNKDYFLTGTITNSTSAAPNPNDTSRITLQAVF